MQRFLISSDSCDRYPPANRDRANKIPGSRRRAGLPHGWLLACLLIFAWSPIHPASADVDFWGDVSPPDPFMWDPGADGYIGYSSHGGAFVYDGNWLESRNGYLGYWHGAVGTATVTGWGSAWNNSADLYVGDRGTGTLNITNGGEVSNRLGILGREMGSSGTATVTGAGSQWHNWGSLVVGELGTGTLNIEDGGQVGNGGGLLGLLSGSEGTVTVTGSGSTWNSGDLYVGREGTGTLNIENGGEVWNSTGYLGYESSGSGTATVTGSGSTLNSADLYVGREGTGTLNIEDGGGVSSSSAYLGRSSGGSGLGTATVTGVGSAWTNWGALMVGWDGTGTLNVEDGGEMSSSSAYLGISSGGSGTGTATVTGAGSQWTNGGPLVVGDSGTGTLTVENGGQVSNATGYLGDLSGSSGAATVSGAGSLWDNSSGLYVGRFGAGTLNIENGGQVSNTTSYLGYGSSGSGTATVTGAGSTWSNEEDLSVGHHGTGTLIIVDGGTVSNVTGWLGGNPYSSGEATVSGAGSAWLMYGDLRVGANGSGTLTVENGGEVANEFGYLGWPNGSGTATVSDAGSTWTTRYGLHIDYTGTLNVEDGGMVAIGSHLVNFGSVDLTGGTGGELVVGGSTPTSSAGGRLIIGSDTGGQLFVEGGGTVSSTTGVLGHSTTGVGTVMVTGAGSTWTNSDWLDVGHNGTGTLNVTDGGLVTTGEIYTSLNDLLGDGTIETKGGIFDDTDIAFNSSQGTQQTIAFGNGGSLNLDIDGSAALGVGRKGNGTLTVAEGVTISSSDGVVGVWLGSHGMATVTGPGSNWTTTGLFDVGFGGTGELNIENGGEVSTRYASLGALPDSSGTVKVVGNGSKLTALNLRVGSHILLTGSPGGNGYLSITEGGEVRSSTVLVGSGTSLPAVNTITVSNAGSKLTCHGSLSMLASGFSPNSASLNILDGGMVTVGLKLTMGSRTLLTIDVGNDSLLNVKDGSGDVDQHGTVRIIAGTGAVANERYTPILAGKWTLFPAAKFQTIGGTWNYESRTFTASESQTVASGGLIQIDLAETQRVLANDPATGWSVGASFLAASGATPLNMTLTAISGDTRGGLETQLWADNPDHSVLGGWLFDLDTGYTPGDPAYLSFDLGFEGYASTDLTVWHYDGSAWNVYLPFNLAVHGTYAGFTVTGFSGYAITGYIIPEPGSLVLLLLGATGLLARRRRSGLTAAAGDSRPLECQGM